MNVNNVIERLEFLKVDAYNGESTEDIIKTLNVICWDLKEIQEEINKFKVFNLKVAFEEISPSS
jgi:hypothetical protein